MNRSLAFASLLVTSGLLVACGGHSGTPDGGSGVDSGANSGDSGQGVDSGSTGADAGSDAGPPACTTGCQFVELGLGSNHSCARRENGQIWCWGRNLEGELGDGRANHEPCGHDSSGFPIDCSATPVQVKADDGTGTLSLLEDAIQLTSKGALSNCAVRMDGTLFCWGLEGISPINGGTPQYRLAAVRVEDFGGVTQASDGFAHTCMVHGSDSQVVCYGYNDGGQLGTGDFMNIRAPDPTKPALDPTDPTMPLTGVLQIEASGFASTTCARTNDGTADRVLCWGSNRQGQLGNGGSGPETCTPDVHTTYPCSSTPVVVGDTGTPLTDVADLSAGFYHVCALGSGSAAGTLRCWGDNRAGQVMQDSSVTHVDVPTELLGLGTVVEVALGGEFTCALMDDGTVNCWGFNGKGQLGDGMMSHGETCTFDSTSGDCSRTPVIVQGIDDAMHIGAGAEHACVIRPSSDPVAFPHGEIWCWGLNDNKQLGDGTLQTRYAPVQVATLPN